jgi:hypothetical protein
MKQFQRLFQIEREGFVTLSEIACDGVASLLLMVVRPFFTCICRLRSSWDSFSSGKACRKTGANAEVTTLEGGKLVIAHGLVASQEVIKTLGTNGGGFFSANSAHPYARSARPQSKSATSRKLKANRT